MNISDQFQKKAIELRREGNSYSEIAKFMRVSRSTVCGWVKNVRLTEAEKKLLNEKLLTIKKRGNLQRSITIRAKTVYKQKVAYEAAEREFDRLSKDPMFTLGMGMWGIEKQGKKGRSAFTFATSAPENLHFMQTWVQKYLNIPSKDLKIRVLEIKSGQSKSFTIGKMDAVRRLIAWQKLTMLYYS